MELFFDTETTGLPLFKEQHDHPGQPDVIQLAAILSDADKIYAQLVCIIDPSVVNSSWSIHPKAEEVHGISKAIVSQVGLDAEYTYGLFLSMAENADTFVCHNTSFDKKLIMTALHRLEDADGLQTINNGQYFCTMMKSTNLCKLPGKFGYKWPKLSELHQFLFGEGFEGAHDALEDVKATRRCYYELKRRGL